MNHALLVTILGAGLSLAGVPVRALGPSVHTVQIENMKFAPENLSLIRGDSIIWVNKDIVPHTVTAEDNSFDSKSIAPGESWKMRPRKAGKVFYKCSFHPIMKATFVAR
jgi:plastocyanin